MAHILVTYHSVLGATHKYAHWLADELQCECRNLSDTNSAALEQHETIIVMSGTYLKGRMPLVGFLKKHWPTLKHKRVLVVAVGRFTPDNPASERSYNRIPEDIRSHIWYIKLPGKLTTKPAGKHGWSLKRENIQRVISAVQVEEANSNT